VSNVEYPPLEVFDVTDTLGIFNVPLLVNCDIESKETLFPTSPLETT